MGQAWRQPRSSAKNYYELGCRDAEPLGDATQDLRVSALRRIYVADRSLPYPGALTSIPGSGETESATIIGVGTTAVVRGAAEVGLAPLEATEAGGPLWEPAIVGRGWLNVKNATSATIPANPRTAPISFPLLLTFYLLW